jgi:hypothetical protein
LDVTAAFRRSFEMSVSREEFFRMLPAVVTPCAVEGDEVRWTDRDGAGAIRLVRLPDRRLGSVVVPRCRVEIALDVSEAQGERFMERFHRAFLRAGG